MEHAEALHYDENILPSFIRHIYWFTQALSQSLNPPMRLSIHVVSIPGLLAIHVV